MLTVVLALALAGDAQQAGGDATTLPVSLDRIRRGLERAPVLKVQAPRPEPIYRVEVVEHPYFLEVPFTWIFDGGGYPLTGPSMLPTSGIPQTPPLAQADALPMLKAAKRALQERAARREVQQAIAEFCAEHSCVLR